MPKIQKTNNSSNRQESSPVLARMRKRILIQAGMALSAIALTLVMVFAMTAAWYTNIVHTSGLTFEVETWGFNGMISSEMEAIAAGPGDDGVIDLKVENTSNSTSSVGVSFSKVLMPPEIQKRIFFYVDTPMVRNNETVERVYLNSQESYTYNLFSQGTLTLTETVHNAPQLKWHWVYDLLGYYVQADVVKMADGSKGLTEIEYLRPIEYDYDKATMEYAADEDGEKIMVLKTVDGTMTPEEFLVAFSKTDGYEGEIIPENVLVDDRGYSFYPVRVDKDGNGVYAYLCSYSEIQLNTAYDTALGLGTAAEKDLPPYKAKLMVSAQKSKNSVVSVSSLSGLSSAIELGVADTIELGSNVTFGEGEVLTIRQGQRVMLDLNGKTITVTDTDTTPFQVEEGGSLTMVNGSIVHETEGNKTTAIQTTGAEVVMSGVNLDGFYRGLRISDNAVGSETLSLDSNVRLVDCEWSTADCTLMVYGNGIASEQKSLVIVENCKLTSNAITITGGGNDDSFGTDIQIIDSTITSAATRNGNENPYSAIYQPQRESVLTIYNSSISGYTGIALKAGKLNIIGSAVQGLGTGLDKVEKFSGSGFNDTGDAVYIETNYNHPIELNISDLVTVVGDKTETKTALLSSENRYALRVYDPAAANVKINIVSGNFSGGTAAFPNEAQFRGYLDDGSEMKIEGKSCFVTEKNQTTQGGGN